MAIMLRSDRAAGNSSESSRPGKVYLIGAGPGDAELITLKGLRYLRSADVILYDRLVSSELLREARPGTTLVYVGKGPKNHTMEQSEINALLIAYARQNRVVVRLKGGDPFVFGRGGEEALALKEAGIAFEIVPGVSSAIAVPAYAGIPVTHRGSSSALTIVTGHEGHAASTIDWSVLAHLGGTLVVLMGVKALPIFTKRLIEAGLDPALPAAVVQDGTTERQKVVTASLADIAERAREAGLTSPATTIIGEVVQLAEPLAWYQANRQYIQV